MKKLRKVFIMLFALSICQIAFSQKDDEDFKYRRSSLGMILIESESFPKKEIVMQSWENYPFPDKYNDHNVEAGTMNPGKYEVTEEDLEAAGLKKDSKVGGAVKGFASDKTKGIIDDEAKEMPVKINKFIEETDLAKEFVKKWFGYEDGKFNMELIQERGYYNASEMDAAIAAGQTRGLASLADAGEELINNTFVTFSKLTFVPNEPIARAVRDAAIKEAKESIKNQLLLDKAIKGAEKVYERTKEGYSVWTKTWLYQLEWNDSIAAVFYNDLWNDKEAFENSDLFTLNYIGRESSQNLVTFSFKEGKREESEVIDLATVRNIDKVYAKLQKKYDVFKPKVPVISTDPIMAKIGLKESIEPGDKFEVLEMTMDPKTGLTVYKKVGTAKVSKKEPIWDNRYNASMDDESKKDQEVTATTFKGSKKVQPGMLLKLKK